MSDVEVKREETLTREEAARQLAALATALAAGDKVELALGASMVKVHVPDEVRCEIEIEIDSDEIELEIELKWTTGKGASSTKASPAKRSGKSSGRRAAGP